MRLGAYYLFLPSRWALIRSWVLNRINTVLKLAPKNVVLSLNTFFNPDFKIRSFTTIIISFNVIDQGNVHFSVIL